MRRIFIRTDAPLGSRPWMNWLIVAANVVVYLAQSADGSLMQRYTLEGYDPQVHHFLTYAFLHINFAHLALNMVVLLILGNNVNDLLGAVGYLAFYLAGVVFSGVGFVIAGGEAVVGASGAVGAVMGAYLVLLPRSHITISLAVAAVEVPSMYFVLLFFLYNVVMSVVSRLTVQQVAYEAHIAGMILGFVVAALLLLLSLMPRHPFDLLSLLSRWNRRRQYRSLVREGYNPFTHLPAATSAGPPSRRPHPDDEQHQVPLHVAALRSRVADAVAQRNITLATALFRELRALDPRQVLPRQAQLDVANQLASQQLYAEAADAYEQFLHHYAAFEQIEEVHLMLGLICARYLNRYARAKECLSLALTRLHGEGEVQMARTELARVEALLAAARPQ